MQLAVEYADVVSRGYLLSCSLQVIPGGSRQAQIRAKVFNGLPFSHFVHAPQRMCISGFLEIPLLAMSKRLTPPRTDSSNGSYNPMRLISYYGDLMSLAARSIIKG